MCNYAFMRSSTLKIHKKIHNRKVPVPKVSEISVNDLTESKNNEKIVDKLPLFKEIWKQNPESKEQEPKQECIQDMLHNQENKILEEHIPLINLKLINEEALNNPSNENMILEVNPNFGCRQNMNQMNYQGSTPSEMYCIRWVMTPTANGAILTPINSLNLNFNNPSFTPIIFNSNPQFGHCNLQNVSFENALESMNYYKN